MAGQSCPSTASRHPCGPSGIVKARRRKRAVSCFNEDIQEIVGAVRRPVRGRWFGLLTLQSNANRTFSSALWAKGPIKSRLLGRRERARMSESCWVNAVCSKTGGVWEV